MPFPRPPGVYFEPDDPPVWTVTEARTDVAGFVGIAERGPLHEPVRIDSWTQFETRFGRRGLAYALLPDAVHGFLANGGRTAWIVRVGQPAVGRPLVRRQDHAGIDLVNVTNKPVFVVRARDPGVGARSLSVRVTPSTQGQFHLQVLADGEMREVWRDLHSEKDRPGPSPTDPRMPNERFIMRVINGRGTNGRVTNGRDDDESPGSQRPARSHTSGSCLIAVEHVGPNEPDQRVVGVQSWVAGARARESSGGPIATVGALGWRAEPDEPAAWRRRSVLAGLTLEHFVGDRNHPETRYGLAALEAVDEVGLIAIPDLMWSPPDRPCPPRRGSPCRPPAPEENMPAPVEERGPLKAEEQRLAQLMMLDHCARLQDRFAILDPPAGLSADQVAGWAGQLQSYAGQFGALYWPWVGVPAAAGPLRWLPPSGHLAGLFARVDLQAGVQKSPANEVLWEVPGVEREVDAQTHGWLNLAGVNVLKATARGIRVLGARTLVPNDPALRAWQYVAVRRLLLMIEESLEQATHWLVHTDNRPERWSDVERVVRNFLLRQWQLGRLEGTTPEDAFRVECSAATNPHDEVQRGRMLCVIGVQPPQPAEFVLVRLGYRGGETGVLSLGESHA